MVAVGLLLLLDPLQDGTVPPLVLVGLVATTVSDILLGYLILAFPWGTLRSNVDRAFLAVSGVALLSANLAALAGFDPRAEGAGFDNPYLVVDDPGMASAAMALSRLTSILVLCGYLAIFAARWARASGPARRIYSPVLVPSTVLVIAIMASTITSGLDVPDDLRLAAGITQALAPGPDPGRLPRRSAAHTDGPLGGRRSRRRARRDAHPGPAARRPGERSRRPGPDSRLLVARDRRLPRRRWIAGGPAIRRIRVGR